MHMDIEELSYKRKMFVTKRLAAEFQNSTLTFCLMNLLYQIPGQICTDDFLRRCNNV